MFIVLHCSFADDPNEIGSWEAEKRVDTYNYGSGLFFTKEEAEEAIKSKFHVGEEEDVDGIFTAYHWDEEVIGHWQVVEISNIKTSDKCIREWIRY
tara:strand:+ start:53 stop:340 length:288 start_codon:yes stop_codon:yes gene_type:complete